MYAIIWLHLHKNILGTKQKKQQNIKKKNKKQTKTRTVTVKQIKAFTDFV